MKKILFLIFALTFLTSGFIKAGDGDEKDPKNKVRLSDTKKFLEDYKLAKKEFNFNTGKLIDFYADFQFGAAGTSANITSANGAGSYTTNSKLGYTSGVMFYLSLFDMYRFSTGFSFNGKSFGVTAPSVIPPGADSTLKNKTLYIVANYLEVPFNFNFGGMLSQKIGLWFNGGPYVGILLNSPTSSSGLGYKNFDFGLMGTLTANYVLAYPFSILLGTSFKYGGLNSLGSSQLVDKITTLNYSLFTGLRLQL